MTASRMLAAAVLLVVLAGAGAAAGSAPARAATVPATSHGRVYPGDPTAESRLVQREDNRLLLIGSAIAKNALGGGPHTMRIDGKPNLVLGAQRRAYTLVDLQRVLRSALSKQPDGTYLLTENIVVAPGATLSLHAEDGLVLHLASRASGFVSIVDFGGSLLLTASPTGISEISSWDPDRSLPDTTTDDGRAYIRVIAGSAKVAYTNFDALGFWSGTTGGFSLTGTRSATSLGAATKNESTAPDAALVTADIAHATFDGDAFGLFVTGAKDVHVSDAVVTHSLVDGIVLHRYVSGSRITRTSSTDNAVDGFRLARGSSDSVLTEVTAVSNGYNGVTIDGGALADGPSATGLDTNNYGDSAVIRSAVLNNAHDGLQVLGGTSIRIADDRLSGNPTAVVVSGKVRGVQVTGNRVSGADSQGIAVRNGASAAQISGNRISGSPTGIFVRSSVASVTGNVVTGATSHGISVVGRAAGSVVRANELGGIGPSAVDVLRTARVGVHGNTVRGWTTTQTLPAFLRSKFPPLTVLWLLLGVLVLVTAGGSLRHRRRGIRHPYPEHAPLAVIAGGPVDPATLGLPARPIRRRREVTQ